MTSEDKSYRTHAVKIHPVAALVARMNAEDGESEGSTRLEASRRAGRLPDYTSIFPRGVRPGGEALIVAP